jgi:hypothetical protein
VKAHCRDVMANLMFRVGDVESSGIHRPSMSSAHLQSCILIDSSCAVYLRSTVFTICFSRVDVTECAESWLRFPLAERRVSKVGQSAGSIPRFSHRTYHMESPSLTLPQTLAVNRTSSTLNGSSRRAWQSPLDDSPICVKKCTL